MKIKPLFKNSKKANMGATLFIGLILFQIIMYIFIRSANADALLTSDIGNFVAPNPGDFNTSSNANMNSLSVTSWYDGFSVGVFNLPWYIEVFYIPFQAVLLGVSIYMMIRGLN